MAGRFFPVQSIHLGSVGTFAGFNEQYCPLLTAGFTANTANGQLGMIVEDSGKAYRLVQFDNGSGDVASVAGYNAFWKTRASFVVTMDETDSEAGVNGVAGGFLAAITDQYYCFIQVGGVQLVKTDGSADVGDAGCGAAADGILTTMAPGGANWIGLPVGIFYTADGAGSTAYMYWLLGNLI